MKTEERLRLDRRIHNQRARLRWFEKLFETHLHAHFRWKRPYWFEYALKLSEKNRELKAQLAQAQQDGDRNAPARDGRSLEPFNKDAERRS